MVVFDDRDLEGLRRVGRVVRMALEAMRAAVRPGVTTAELNRQGAEVLDAHGARSAPMAVYRFPAETCISVNDQIVHGIPGPQVLADGDLVKLDVTAELDGLMADAAITVPVGSITDEVQRLVDCPRKAFEAAMKVCRVGYRVNDIGRAVEEVAQAEGFPVLRELTGHGIGRTIHEKPIIRNYYAPEADEPLVAGLVITVEPMMTLGLPVIVHDDDGWTIRTGDGALSSHYEQTLRVTAGEPEILTAAA